MRFITFRSNNGPDDPDAYWRRRFFILGGGLAVLMLLAWLFGSGGPSKQATRTAAARASVAARENRSSLPGAATGRPYGQSASPSPSASAIASAAASGAPGKGGGCAAGRVVLSLFTTQPAYQAKQRPTFRVYAVSTSESACRLKYGPSAVRIVVTQHGKTVWDSGACPAARKGTKTTSLTPGVPQGVTLAWDRMAPGPCGGTLPSGGSGTFETMAEADGHFSPVHSFKLLPGMPSSRPVSKPSVKSPASASRSGPRTGRSGRPRPR